MQKLEFIRFMFSNRLLSKNYTHYKDFLQLVIKNSPNLMKIAYWGPFDIDFSCNRKLKVIKHTFDYSDKIDANGLKKTLDQTANSLKKLRLSVYMDDMDEDVDEEEESDDDEENPQNKLDLPKMPMLTFLSAYDIIVDQNLDDMTPKLLPNLKYLKLKNYGVICGSNTELTILQELVKRRGGFEHSGIIKLSFIGVKNPLLLKDLRSWFPNLETFVVELISIKDSENILAKLFKTLKDVNLKNIKIKMSFHYDTVDLIDALEPNYLQLFEGLKLLHLENIAFLSGFNTDSVESSSRYAWKDGIAGPIDTFEKILLHINEVQGLKVVFQNFLLNGSIVRRILGFIDDNKIPINFT